MVQFPAAISCASLIASETKAKITATMKEVTAVRYSILRCLDIVVTFDYMNGGGARVPPPFLECEKLLKNVGEFRDIVRTNSGALNDRTCS